MDIIIKLAILSFALQYVKGTTKTTNVNKNKTTLVRKRDGTSFGRINFSQDLNTNQHFNLVDNRKLYKKISNIIQLTIVHVNMSMRTKQ